MEEACEPRDAALLDAALQDLPLPRLPDDVDEDDEPVVIARWAGPRWGGESCP